MERDLATEGNKNRKSGILGTLESFFGLNGSYYSREKWLGLYLAGCKLLDLAMSLPSEVLPQFQVYRWAFVDSPGVEYDLQLAREEHEVSNSITNKIRSEKNTKEGEQQESSKKKGEIANKGRHSKADKPEATTKEKEMTKLSLMNAPLSSKSTKQKKPEKKPGDKMKGKKDKETTKSKSDQFRSKFVPYLSRITTHLCSKESNVDSPTKRQDGKLILTMSKIDSLDELLPFFLSVTGKGASESIDLRSSKTFDIEYSERLIENDFQDIWAKS